ncbi:MAG: phosphonatase-like hydrolase [Bacteroidia bacterium]|nr:phosphonatase-like hydrolase [Bacteroidia bacterium]
MKIQLVIFDMAGTTVFDQDNVNEALQNALKAGGLDVTRDEVNTVMGLPKPEAIRILLTEKTGAAPEARVAELHQGFLRNMIDYYENSPEIREIPGASETFGRLRAAGIKVGLDTGFSRDIADTIIRRLGWDKAGLLDVTVTSDEVPRGRPHPDLAFRAMEILGIQDASTVAKAGDTPSDLLEGSSAGCGMVIGVLSGASTRAELEPHPHTHILDSLADLPSVLGI